MVAVDTDAPSPAWARELTARLVHRRDLLMTEAHRLGGIAFTRSLTDLFDETLAHLWEETVSKHRAMSRPLALIAVGGYGRRQLCPFSDIDLMVLHDGAPADTLAVISESIFYPLWNARCDVGHAVRSAGECLALARTDFESATTLLDARLIAGDENLFDEMAARVHAGIRRRHRRFVADLRADVRVRWDAYGEGAYVLEPHIKEGCGGLRDVHQVLWATKALVGGSTLQDAVAAGYLSEHGEKLLSAALDWLLAVRIGAHLVAERKTDRLYVDYQPDLAAHLGHGSPDELMRTYHERAAQIKHISSLFWKRLAPRSGRLLRRAGKTTAAVSTLGAGLLAGDDGMAEATDPAVALHFFAMLAQQELQLAPDVVEAIHETLARSTAAPIWSTQAHEDFLSILRAGDAGLEHLETMNDIGLLPRLLPHWDRVRYQPPAGAYHRYTIDMHSFQAVAELARITRDRSGLPAALHAELTHPDTLLVATLLHDIGKPGDDHPERGARLAAEICRVTGLTSDTETVAFLVANHLLLPEMATRRDIGEMHLLDTLADRIGSAERLKMLYLLTVADSIATGLTAWNHWKDALVQQLFFGVLHVLEMREGLRAPEPGPPSRARAHARDTLADSSREEVDAFLAHLPDSYFAGGAGDAVHLHYALVNGLAGEEVRALARPMGSSGTIEFAVGASDRPGLLAKVAGVLALHNRNILGAQTYSLSDGTALQLFLTTDYFDTDAEDVDWDAVAGDVRHALAGRMAIDYRLARKLKAYSPRTPHARVPEIVLDNDISPAMTVIEVHADDRIGLLYTIAKALHDLQLDIRVAKVATAAERAVDVFYVVDGKGAKVLDEDHVDEIKRGVEHALQGS